MEHREEQDLLELLDLQDLLVQSVLPDQLGLMVFLELPVHRE